jgi:hypothetical protein
MNNLKKRLFLVWILIPLLIVVWTLSSPCPKRIMLWAPDKTSNEMPNEISFKCYVRRMIFVIPDWSEGYPVVILIEGLDIADQPYVMSDIYDFYDARKNVKLSIDDREIFIESVVEKHRGVVYHYPNIAATYYLGARPFIPPGIHTARVEIRTLSGKEIVYEVEFTIK